MNMFTETMSKIRVFTVLLLTCAAVWFATSDKPQAIVAPAKVDVVDSSFSALSESYDANSIAFDKAWSGKSFRIHASVVSVIGTSYAPAMIVSEDGQTPYPADFSSSSDLSAIKPGESVTFTCSEFTGNMMNGCSLER